MPSSADRSVALIQRLLEDPKLREEFRREPAAVCRRHGVPEIAEQLGGQERGMMTLEIRESRSSLAGVVVAAAAEGIDFANAAARAAPHVERDAAAVLRRLIESFSQHKHPRAPHAKGPTSGSSGRGQIAPQASIPGRPSAATPGATPAAPGGTPAAPSGTAGAPGAGSAAPSGTAASPGGAAASSGGAAASSGSTVPSSAGRPTATQPPSPPLSDVARRGASPGLSAAVDPHGQSALHGAGHDPSVPGDHVGTHGDLVANSDYPGDKAPKPAIAAWMAEYAVRVGLPPELPVMAALAESNLTNTPTGDRDSVGYFQMRTSIWDQGPYLGYEHRPELQLKWFIEHALAVKQANSGDQSYGADANSWGNWIAEVEQPAAEYRYRYQLQLDVARGLLSSFHPSGAPAPPVPQAPADRALHIAMRYLGTPFQASGSSPSSGLDGSGLVERAYAHIGVHLPNVAADQFNLGEPVPREQLRPGDVVFFQDSNGFVHHEGLYIGDGRFLQAPESGGNVEVSRLDDPTFAHQYAGARRFAADAQPHFARTLPVLEPTHSGATISSTGYAFPLDSQYMHAFGRTDEGVDIETAPDGAVVYSMTPGVVSAVASDPSGFGPNYPVVQVSRGSLAGQYIYYGHVARSLVQPGQHVVAGQPIAIMGHTGDAEYLGHGHIEIGFSDANGNPVDHSGVQPATPSGQRMRDFLTALAGGVGIRVS